MKKLMVKLLYGAIAAAIGVLLVKSPAIAIPAASDVKALNQSAMTVPALAAEPVIPEAAPSAAAASDIAGDAAASEDKAPMIERSNAFAADAALEIGELGDAAADASDDTAFKTDSGDDENASPVMDLASSDGGEKRAAAGQKIQKKDPCRAYGQYYVGINPKNGKTLCCHKGEHLIPGTVMCAGGSHGGGGGIVPPGNCYSQRCPVGYYCDGAHCISTNGQWHKGCYTGADCQSGYSCDTNSGNCYPDHNKSAEGAGKSAEQPAVRQARGNEDKRNIGDNGYPMQCAGCSWADPRCRGCYQ
ncbi:MAG: hypothetical protein PHP45_07435 [Elusimicrobiales bacterium]|nr:hypothetical protein [Elusimicrobiales bacterium]